MNNWTIPDYIVEQVLEDIRNGNDEHVEQFFVVRPDWQDQPQEQQESLDLAHDLLTLIEQENGLQPVLKRDVTL